MGKIAIAIDGPAAAGKSTVGAVLAGRIGYLYFDTGVMYRAVARVALDRGIAIEDEAAVTALSEQLMIEVFPPTVDDGRQNTVLADGVDVSWGIREADVTVAVSPVSAYKGVREALTRQQRRIGAAGGVVMVGRDIGTVVLPDAPVKIYLDATPEERANRRLRQDAERGKVVPFDDVLADIKRRDRIDSTREAAPLRAAVDAVRLDSTELSVGQVVSQIEEIVSQAMSCKASEMPASAEA